MTTQGMLDRLSENQQEEAFSNNNFYFAGLTLGHSPSVDEAVEHYYNATGPHFTVYAFFVHDTASEPAPDIRQVA